LQQLKKKMQGIPYVGSKITLISRSGFRYEGTLFSIDSQVGTVALREVTIIGNDGKPLPGSKVYEYIVFKGTDIKDLTVSSAPQPPSPQNYQPVQQQVVQQPVQPQQTQVFGQQQFPTYSQPKPKPTVVEVKKEEKVQPQVVKKTPVQEPKKEHVHKTEKKDPIKKEDRPREERHVETREHKKPVQHHVQPRTEVQHRPVEKKPVEKTKFDKDFDFESSTSQFVKGSESNNEDRKRKDEILKSVNQYQKDSFFDSISRESTGNTFDRDAQKKKDIDTFGTAYAHNNFYRGRGRGGGRGRGNSRGGRGRGQHQENQ
jgi:protein LSM14